MKMIKHYGESMNKVVLKATSRRMKWCLPCRNSSTFFVVTLPGTIFPRDNVMLLYVVFTAFADIAGIQNFSPSRFLVKTVEDERKPSRHLQYTSNDESEGLFNVAAALLAFSSIHVGTNC